MVKLPDQAIIHPYSVQVIVKWLGAKLGWLLGEKSL